MSKGSSPSLQEWLHWFEIGEGARWVRAAVLVIGVLLLTWFVGYKQFRGPLTETTLEQAIVGKQLAAGEGFTTLVNYPQSFAWAESSVAHGDFVDVRRPLPELHQPPLYSMVIAGVLAVMPESVKAGLFGNSPSPPNGFGADYILLGINIVLLWIAAAQAYFLAKRLFGVWCGLISSCALLLSAPVWAATVAVNGTPLTMVLLLAFYNIWAQSDYRLSTDEVAKPWMQRTISLRSMPLLVGVLSGLLFLSDYAAIVFVPIIVTRILIRIRGWNLVRGGVIFGLVFLAIVAPWLIRNTLLTGNPLALASQNIVLKAGDSTAEPSTQRATFSTASPGFDFNKVSNKVLTSLQRGVGEQMWSGGSLFLTAFFIAALVYRFKNPVVNRHRWIVVVSCVLFALAQALMDSGEGERSVWVCMTPLIIILGTGFFLVLVSSSEMLAPRIGFAALILLAMQALPLAREALEPRRMHFNYPPYLPPLYIGMGKEMARGRDKPLAWMSDVPAGAAWYSGQRVWMQPSTIDGVAYASRWQPVRALVLTSATLSKPFFSDLLKSHKNPLLQNVGQHDWADLYRGLVTGHMPEYFSLSVAKQVAPDMFVILDPTTQATGQ